MFSSLPAMSRLGFPSRAMLASAAATAALVVAGCSSDDKTSSEPSKQAAAPPAAASAGELAGTYERQVTSADIERTDKVRSEAGPNQEKPKPGPGQLIITTSEITFQPTDEKPPLVIRQNVTATADRLEIGGYIRPDLGSFCGPETPQNASYGWTRDAAGLHLTAKGDPCADRDSMLTGVWKPAG